MKQKKLVQKNVSSSLLVSDLVDRCKVESNAMDLSLFYLTDLSLFT